MLESGDVLRTWRLQHMPVPCQPINAVPIGDHRLAYLDYEGPVGGGRGSVKRFDSGTYEIIEESPKRLVTALHGDLINTNIELQFSVQVGSTKPR
jgi:hypothetical protein